MQFILGVLYFLPMLTAFVLTGFLMFFAFVLYSDLKRNRAVSTRGDLYRPINESVARLT